jgi:hypothetical protein
MLDGLNERELSFVVGSGGGLLVGLASSGNMELKA